MQLLHAVTSISREKRRWAKHRLAFQEHFSLFVVVIFSLRQCLVPFFQCSPSWFLVLLTSLSFLHTGTASVVLISPFLYPVFFQLVSPFPASNVFDSWSSHGFLHLAPPAPHPLVCLVFSCYGMFHCILHQASIFFKANALERSLIGSRKYRLGNAMERTVCPLLVESSVDCLWSCCCCFPEPVFFFPWCFLLFAHSLRWREQDFKLHPFYSQPVSCIWAQRENWPF